MLHTTNVGSVTHVGIATNSVATCWVTNAADEDVTGSYTFGDRINGQLEVTKRPVTLTSATDSKVYDGTALTAATVTASTGVDTGFVSGEGAAYNVTGTITEVGNVTNLFTYSLNTNTAATDYNIAVAYGTLTVTPKDGITVTITGNHDSQVYDGTPKTVTGYTVDAGAWNAYYDASDVTCNVSASATRTVKDTTWMNLVPANFTNTNPNFTNVNFVVTDGYMAITPITIPITITANSDGKVYDGTPLTNSGFTYTGTLASGDVLEATVAGTVTHVADSANRVTSYRVKRGEEIVTGNYTFNPSVDGTLTVTPRPMTVTAASHQFAYNGNVQSITDLPLADRYTVSGLATTDATAQHTATVVGSIQYPSQSPVADTASNFTFTGSYANLNDDYTVSYEYGALTMTYGTPIELVISSLGDTWSYDGSSHSKNGMSVSVGGAAAVENATNSYTIPNSNGDVITITLGTSVTNVTAGTPNTIASYTIKNGSVDVSGKYNVLLGTGDLVVTPKSATITAASHTWDYDGYVHSDAGYTVTGLVAPDTLTASVAGTITTPGTAANTVTNYSMTVGQASNYTFTLVAGELKVQNRTTPIELTITANSDTKVYDGTALSSDGYTLHYNGSDYTVGANGIFDFANGDRLYVDVVGSNTHVSTNGSNTNQVTSWTVLHGEDTVKASYHAALVSGNLTITPRPLTLTSASHVWTYDHQAHADSAVTVEGWIAGDGTLAASNYDGWQTITEVGDRTNTFGFTFPATAQAQDYDTTKVYGTLTVNSTDMVTVTITGHSDTVTYNGQLQKVIVRPDIQCL